MKVIFHITRQVDWLAAAESGVYCPDSFDSDGFIHCSTAGQLIAVANQRYGGQAGLVLLAINVPAVGPAIVYEDLYESGKKFPHIYGPLNMDAVAAVIPFPARADGRFVLPLAAAALDTPLLEFDPDPSALLQAAELLPRLKVPPGCVLCFFQDVIDGLQAAGRLRLLYELRSEIAANPVYELTVDGRSLAVCHPGVGAPLAAGFLEELIALGCDHFIACGGAGVLDSSIAVGHVIVPLSAVRDEGASFHYLPPGREVQAGTRAVAAIQRVLQRRQTPYLTGKSWTTDGLYRETRARIDRRRAEGCLTVEMEAAAFFAVAVHRGVEFGQLLYGGDDVSGNRWDPRRWDSRTSTRERLFWLAVEACLELQHDNG